MLVVRGDAQRGHLRGGEVGHEDVLAERRVALGERRASVRVGGVNTAYQLRLVAAAEEAAGAFSWIVSW